jgi:hypothetical protein
MQAIFDDVSGAAKLGLVRELGGIRKELPNVKGVDKLGMVKRIKEIRALLLGGKPEKAEAIAIDPNDKAGSIKAITDYLNNSAVPDLLRAAERETIRKLEFLLFKDGNVIDLPSEVFNPYYEALGKLTKNVSGDVQVQTFEHFAENGKELVDFPADDILRIQSEFEFLRNQPVSDDPEVVAIMNELEKESQTLADKQVAIGQQRRDLYSQEGFEKEYRDLGQEYDRLWQERTNIFAQLQKLGQKKYDDRNAQLKAIREQTKPFGQIIIDSLHAESPITPEQADAWSNAVKIDKSVVDRLKKQGYPLTDLRRDIAEFYRITQGKLRTIEIRSTGAKRAHAGSIHGFEGNYITPGSSFTKTTLWHELAHHLEADTAALWAAKGFLEKRRKGEELRSLRSLTGNKGYRSDEVAYEDEFLNHYIGKYYRDSTEVFSMGVQYLADPEQAAMFAAKDPEMFKLIAGYLTADLSPAMKALQTVQFAAADESQSQRDDMESKYQAALNALADGIEIVDDGWFSNLDQESMNFVLDRFGGYGGIGDKNAKFVGSWQGFRVFAGKFKSRQSRRVSKGYTIAYEPRENTLKNDRGYFNIPQFEPIHGDLINIKAALRIAKESYNFEIYQVAWRLFGKYDARNDIIQQAQKIQSAGNQA